MKKSLGRSFQGRPSLQDSHFLPGRDTSRTQSQYCPMPRDAKSRIDVRESDVRENHHLKHVLPPDLGGIKLQHLIKTLLYNSISFKLQEQQLEMSCKVGSMMQIIRDGGELNQNFSQYFSLSGSPTF